jgi:hypothetical protein
MGRLRVVLCAAALAVLGACGADEGDEAGVPSSVGYMSRESIVLIAPTDLEGEQLGRLERLLAPALRDFGGPTTLRGLIETSIQGEEGISFERDVEPLLGAELVVALAPEGTSAALETPDGDKLEDLLVKLGFRQQGEHRGAKLYELEGTRVAVDDGTLLASLDPEGPQRAIDRMRDGQGHDPAALAEALPSVGGEPFLRAAGAARAVIDVLELGEGAEMPWIRAARSLGAALRLEDDAIVAAARVSTDPGGLSEEDLPLASGEEAPPVGDVDGAIAAGNRDQSRTTVFLAQLARRAFPGSTFVRSVEEIEADLGISFEEEVLAQFNGPSASVATPAGDFAAVSDVADPERMRELLPRLAPRLPEVLRGLQGLGSRGLVALLLFAPDAPLAPGMLPSLQAGIDVRELPGEGPLFQITGLDQGDMPLAGPGTVVFGMIGDRFVVATDVRRARAVAEMPVSEIDGARGAAVARANLQTWSEGALEQALGIRTAPLGEAVGELEASTRGLEGRLRIEITD